MIATGPDRARVLRVRLGCATEPPAARRGLRRSAEARDRHRERLPARRRGDTVRRSTRRAAGVGTARGTTSSTTRAWPARSGAASSPASVGIRCTWSPRTRPRRTRSRASATGSATRPSARSFYVLGFKGDPFVVPDGLLFALLGHARARPRRAIPERGDRVDRRERAGADRTVRPLLRHPVQRHPHGRRGAARARRDHRRPVRLAGRDRARHRDRARVRGALHRRRVDRGPRRDPAVDRAPRAAWRVASSRSLAELAVAAAIVGWAQDRAFGSPFTTPYKYVHDGLDASWRAYQFGQVVNAGVGVFITGEPVDAVPRRARS